jgi:dihydropyrimidine dehydrogenase (NAD+) subunit PreT
MALIQKSDNPDNLPGANFEPSKPELNSTLAYQESARCLFCYDAPCIKACPTEIDIPLFIRQIHTQNLEGAARTIYQSNYFGNICGKVCPTEVLCEGACVYNHEHAKPIQIGQLQSYATSAILKKDSRLFSSGKGNGFRVAVVGAGPAGISCACELRLLGYEVDIYETRDKPSGLVLYGCAPYKVTNEEVLEEVEWLQGQFGFKIFYSRGISSADQWLELEQAYDAIFLGMGLGAARTASLHGAKLKGVWNATDFIAAVKINPQILTIGRRVVVIGGGNTAMDAAAESLLLGAEEVTVAYRRSKADMTAYEFEQEHARKLGVRCIFQKTPIEIAGKEQVEGILLATTTVEHGQAIPQREMVEYLACDTVVLAIGQQQGDWGNQISGLAFTANGQIEHNPETLQTTKEKYFAGGDLLNGGAEVVYAAADGKKAAQGINRYLMSTSSISDSPRA